MRILHIDTGMGWRGGQQQVLWLLEGAQVRSLDQVLLVPEGSELARRAAPLQRVGRDLSGLEMVHLSSSSGRILSIDNARRVREAAHGVDLIHAHDAHAHTLAWAAQKMTNGKFPPVVVARRVAFPIRLLGRWKNRQPAWFIAVSEFVRRQIVASGIPPSRARVIYDGVRVPSELPRRIERLQRRRELGITDDNFVLGALSSLSPEKLLDETVQLLSVMPSNVRFVLGIPASQASSPEAVRIKRLAEESGCGTRYQLLGVASNADRLLQSLDAFVYLSKSEGLGSAILLAMAHGLPVVASRVGGIPEIVQHQRTGLLVDPDADGWIRPLVAAVERLQESAEMRHRYGTSGREFVLEYATSDKMVARTVTLYEEILACGLAESGQV
ncbi:MAG: glycosyltransferase family 1 protein [Acidobacteria bacterium]|nr:glycosyltransferase family 1 protein [Acidobacteriota bacterium]